MKTKNRETKNFVKKYSIVLILSLMGAQSFAHISRGNEGRGGGHYVQTCAGDWVTLDQYRSIQENKKIDVLTDSLTKDGASILINAIQNLTSEFPDLGKALSHRLSSIEWSVSCYPLKTVNDHGYETALALNIQQGAIQDVKNNIVIIGQIENTGKAPEAVARLLAHELFLNMYGIDSHRDAVAQSSNHLISNYSIPKSGPVTSGFATMVRIKLEYAQKCDVVLSINGRSGHNYPCVNYAPVVEYKLETVAPSEVLRNELVFAAHYGFSKNFISTEFFINGFMMAKSVAPKGLEFFVVRL